MKALVIGSGGREHTIAWKLAQSLKIEEIICVPGNGGTADEAKCKNMNGDAIEIAKNEKVDFAGGGWLDACLMPI